MEQLTNRRAAGILTAISSLSSAYGIGGFGAEAKAYADFLHRSYQKYWQLLPLNPTTPGMGHSPYSSISSMAGNTLLIDPDTLMANGLLSYEDVASRAQPETGIADYHTAERIKNELFNVAYNNYKHSDKSKNDFENFCKNEAYWLHDYALYVVIKEQEYHKPWFQWTDKYKYRDGEALNSFADQYTQALDKVKWLQFIFIMQWRESRGYCNSLNIKLFGDLPFYVSYDSADVWANPHLFCLDETGNMTGVAGVPPDYFSADGQLWGMPTFNWAELKKSKYEWWIKRLRKNLELFDLLRIDHFRALDEYWQVPAGAENARNGEWKPGPGADFFSAIEAALGSLPFVAEDLGDKMQTVYNLRDEVGLPGMKVLQFAFGDNIAISIDVPHNYGVNFICYTGTHDNNTTLGWYTNEATDDDKKRLAAYTGIPPSAANVHSVLGRLAYASVAKTAILPIQDVLGLGAEARMNTPSSGSGNWQWRLQPGQLTGEVEEQLREWVKMFNRY